MDFYKEYTESNILFLIVILLEIHITLKITYNMYILLLKVIYYITISYKITGYPQLWITQCSWFSESAKPLKGPFCGPLDKSVKLETYS